MWRTKALTNAAQELKRHTRVVYLALRHPRTPWHAKVLAGCVVAYAFSPVDLVPDFIPVLGYLDDLLLIPLGVALVLALVPTDVIDECRSAADQQTAKPLTRLGAAGAVAVVALWVLLAWLTWRWVTRS